MTSWVSPEAGLQCSVHPYFTLTEYWFFFGAPTLIVAGLVILLVGIKLLRRRSRAGAVVYAISVLMLSVCVGSFSDVLDARVALRLQCGADDLARLQRELQAREEALEHYSLKHPGLSIAELKDGFLETQPAFDSFQFGDPTVPPLRFTVSDWRDNVPRIVVSFDCGNNILFDSRTMSVEQLD